MQVNVALPVLAPGWRNAFGGKSQSPARKLQRASKVQRGDKASRFPRLRAALRDEEYEPAPGRDMQPLMGLGRLVFGGRWPGTLRKSPVHCGQCLNSH